MQNAERITSHLSSSVCCPKDECCGRNCFALCPGPVLNLASPRCSFLPTLIYHRLRSVTMFKLCRDTSLSVVLISVVSAQMPPDSQGHNRYTMNELEPFYFDDTGPQGFTTITHCLVLEMRRGRNPEILIRASKFRLLDVARASSYDDGTIRYGLACCRLGRHLPCR